MLLSPHDGAVDHRVFVVGVGREMLEYPLPHTAFGPTAEPPVYLDAVAELLRYVAPRHTRPVTIEHGVDEQSIVCRGYPDRAVAPRQDAFDPFPLVVAQPEPPHHRSAPYKLTVYESEKPPRRNRLPTTRRRLTVECGNCDSPAQPHSVRAKPSGRNRLIDDRP